MYESKLNTKDALGNEIVIGKRYGWSTDKSGVTKVSYGEAYKFSPRGGVSFRKVKTTEALWFDEPYKIPTEGGSANVKPIKCFPICG